MVMAFTSAGVALTLHPESLTAILPSIVAVMVTWAFALAGSALTPVFLLTIWWRGITAAGAIAGMVTGAATAVTMVVFGTRTDDWIVGEALLTPTLIAAPLAATMTILVSWRTVPPPDVDGMWLRMHGTASDREAERLARLMIRSLRPRPRRERKVDANR
jgi:cation/acetate symporter